LDKYDSNFFIDKISNHIIPYISIIFKYKLCVIISLNDFWIIINFRYWIYVYVINYIDWINYIDLVFVKHPTFDWIFSKRRRIVCGRLQTSKDKNKTKKQCTIQGTCKSGMDAKFSSFRRRRLSWELLSLSKRDGVSEKKALARGWQIGVFPRRRLKGWGMSEGSMVSFPQVNTTNEYARVSRYRGRAQREDELEKRNRRRLDEKGVSFASLAERKNKHVLP